MEEKKKNGFATAALVISIIAICTSFIPIINNASFIMAVLAIIFCIVALIQKAGKGKIIASFIIGILAIVIVINSQKSFSDSLDKWADDVNSSFDNFTGDNTEEILENSLDLQLGEFQVEEGEYYAETKMVVKAKNKTSETKSFSVQIEAVKEDGSRIDNDYITINSLGAGQSQDFEIFTYVPSDKLDIMRTATFNIVEVSMY